MSTEPFDEILGYLGLGAGAPPAPRSLGRELTREDSHRKPDEQCLARRGGASLWQAQNDSAQWIELRGRFATFRATRPKAMLLLSLEREVDAWANGLRPSKDAADTRIRALKRPEGPRLEIRHKTWKPIRLCETQARGLMLFRQEIAAFVARPTR